MAPRESPAAALPSLGVGLVAGLVVWLAAAGRPAADGAPMPVRYPEGALHGFLVLRTLEGRSLAQGDQLVDVRDGAVESRMRFRFADGSVHDERVTFTQDSVFRMRRYTLAQHGPAFPADVEVALDGATGWYRVVSRARDGKREVEEDTLDLPPDTYNGMLLTIAKNLPAGAAREVHFVAFTPKPQLIGLGVEPAGGDTLFFGAVARTAVHYVVKPRLGAVRQIFATLLGKDPPDNHVWLVTDDLPGFVRFEGPLYLSGPAWRIELAAPRWPR
jgi:hypothetical protein